MNKILAFALSFLAWSAPLYATVYTIAPDAYKTVLDGNGNPISNAKICTYVAGTSTPATTYADSSGTANANPLRADTAGRYVMYLAPGSSYKFIFQTASGTDGICDGALIKTVDNISAMGLGSVQANDIGQCEGRMTLTSGTPVTTADVTAATTIYFAPYKGNVCATYDATNGAWTLTTFSEVSLALGTDAASKPYDLFGYSNSGTFTLERLAWTNDTTRATALTTQDGIYVKAGQLSRRYLGTYRTTTVQGQTEDSVTKRFVWNFYNRQRRALQRFETASSWTYTTTVYHQANASTTNQVAFVIGLAESPVTLTVAATLSNSSAGVNVAVAIGLDSTSAAASNQAITSVATQVINYIISVQSTYGGVPAVGYHFLTWLEISAATGTTTWYSAAGAGSSNQSGLLGWIEG